MLDLSSILLHLGLSVNFKPHHRILLWKLDNVLLVKLSIFVLTISVPVLFSLSLFDIPFVVVLELYFKSFLFVVVFVFAS